MRNEALLDLALATALLVIAGFVDAVGFLTLRHLFVSFASGNSTQFAIALGGVSLGEASMAGALVGLFVVGVICGRILATAGKDWRRPVVLIAETALLGAAALLPLPGARSALLMTLAMGAQNMVVHRAGRMRTSVSYITGTLVNFGERLADALLSRGSFAACVPYLVFWIGLVCGGAAGGIADLAFGARALLIPAGGLVVLAAATAAEAWRARESRRTGGA